MLAAIVRVVLAGSAAAAECHSNYKGKCDPIASDVDCAGGSGNAPEYVRGPVEGVGLDDYDLRLGTRGQAVYYENLRLTPQRRPERKPSSSTGRGALRSSSRVSP